MLVFLARFMINWYQKLAKTWLTIWIIWYTTKCRLYKWGLRI